MALRPYETFSPADSPTRIFSVVIAFVAGLSTCPWVQPPGADRELYRYVGMLIAKGGTPYRDIFDIKPPLIFLAAYNGSAWSLWWVVNVAVGMAAWLLYGTLKRLNVPYPLLLVTLCVTLLRLPSIVEGGGLSYELSAAVACMVLCLSTWAVPPAMLIGALTALVFMTQQSDILALAPVCFYAWQRSPVRHYAAMQMFKGKVAVVAVVVVVMAMRHALRVWAYDTLVFPVTYFGAQAPVLGQRAALFGQALFATRLAPWLVFVVVITVMNTLRTLTEHFEGDGDTYQVDGQAHNIAFLQRTMMVALGLQSVVICVSGKFYGHYFLSFVVYLTVWIGTAWRTHTRVWPRWHTSRIRMVAVLVLCVGAATTVIVSPRLRHSMRLMATSTQLMVDVWRSGSTPYEQAMVRERAALGDIRGQDGQLFVFRGYGKPLALYTDLLCLAPTRFVHTLFWDKGRRPPTELNTIIGDLDAHQTRYVLDYSSSKPLPTAAMAAVWETYRDRTYAGGPPLLCNDTQDVCGRLYTRRHSDLPL